MSLGFVVYNPNAIAKYHKSDLSWKRSSILLLLFDFYSSLFDMVKWHRQEHSLEKYFLEICQFAIPQIVFKNYSKQLKFPIIQESSLLQFLRNPKNILHILYFLLLQFFRSDIGLNTFVLCYKNAKYVLLTAKWRENRYIRTCNVFLIS